MKAREYQAEALNKIYDDLHESPNVLLRAIMGAGKTFMAVKMIERLNHERPGSNFLILAHKKELVEQFSDAFEKFTSPQGMGNLLCRAQEPGHVKADNNRNYPDSDQDH